MDPSDAINQLKMKRNANGGYYSPGLAVSAEKKINILEYYSLGNGIRKSAKMAKVAPSTAHKVINSRNLLDKKRGRKSFEPHSAVGNLIVQLTRKYPWFTHKFVSHVLMQTFGNVEELVPFLSCHYVRQVRLYHGFKYKRLNCIAYQRTTPRIRILRQMISNFMLQRVSRENVLWIDETHLVSKDYNPKYGYFEKNAKNVCVCPFTSNLSATFIVCMSYTRVVAIYYKDSREHGVNSLDYLSFLRLIPTRYQNYVHFQDNARIHHDELIQEYTHVNDLKILNNAQYSSDFMAIESLFNVVKNGIRSLSYLNQDNAKGLFIAICQRIQSSTIMNIVDSTYKRYEKANQSI
jgi:hypothetical protein